MNTHMFIKQLLYLLLFDRQVTQRYKAILYITYINGFGKKKVKMNDAFS